MKSAEPAPYRRRLAKLRIANKRFRQPRAVARGFSASHRARLMVNTELLEYICQEDNFDPEHISGPAQVSGGAPAKR